MEGRSFPVLTCDVNTYLSKYNYIFWIVEYKLDLENLYDRNRLPNLHHEGVPNSGTQYNATVSMKKKSIIVPPTYPR